MECRKFRRTRRCKKDVAKYCKILQLIAYCLNICKPGKCVTKHITHPNTQTLKPPELFHDQSVHVCCQVTCQILTVVPLDGNLHALMLPQVGHKMAQLIELKIAEVAVVGLTWTNYITLHYCMAAAAAAAAAAIYCTCGFKVQMSLSLQVMVCQLPQRVSSVYHFQ
jgi:hypothetical protein